MKFDFQNGMLIMVLSFVILIITTALSFRLDKTNSEIRRLSERLDKIESKQETVGTIIHGGEIRSTIDEPTTILQ